MSEPQEEWVLVPREMTSEMVEAVIDSWSNNVSYGIEYAWLREAIRREWRFAIAAAPRANQSQAEPK